VAFAVDFCNINTTITPTGRTVIRIPDTVARKEQENLPDPQRVTLSCFVLCCETDLVG